MAKRLTNSEKYIAGLIKDYGKPADDTNLYNGSVVPAGTAPDPTKWSLVITWKRTTKEPAQQTRFESADCDDLVDIVNVGNLLEWFQYEETFLGFSLNHPAGMER